MSGKFKNGSNDFWKKISTNACGKGTYELDGWIIQHCGHQNLAAAKRFQKEVRNAL